MKIKVKRQTTFDCTLERAFKTPMLCDVTKVHTGYGLMPKVVRCTDDQNWGQVGSSKKVYVAKSLTHKGGYGSDDHVLERIENKYWKIQIDNFQAWMLGFNKLVGEWRTTEMQKDKILIEYTYTMYTKNPIMYPINWLFTKLFWRRYMKQVLENVRQLTLHQEPYQYD